MAKKAKRAKKAKAAPRTAKAARKKRAVKKAAFEPMAAMMRATARTAHPDRRFPVWNDDQHEILCKWIDAENAYHCDKVPIGGDWNP